MTICQTYIGTPPSNSTYNLPQYHEMQEWDNFKLKFSFELRKRFDFLESLECKYKFYTINYLHKIKYMVDFTINKKQYEHYLINFPTFVNDDDMNYINVN